MLQEILHTYGYAALVALLVLDSSGVPWPTEATLLVAGALAQSEGMNIYLVGASALTGALMGSSLSYYLGRRMGPVLMQRIARFFRLSPHHLAKVDDWFNRYGKRAVLLGRLVPFVRCFTGFPAGVARMPFGQYLLFSALGYALYISLTLSLGYGGSFLGTLLNDLELALWFLVPLALMVGYFKYGRKWMAIRRGKG